MKKNWIAAGVSVMMIVGALTGCGSSSAERSTSGETAAAEAEVVTEAADEGVTYVEEEFDYSSNPVSAFAGPYMDEGGADFYLDVEANDETNGAWVEVYTNIDEYSYAYWEMYGTYNEDGTISYKDGIKGIMKEDESTGEFTEEDEYTDGTGTFTVKDGKITWKDDKEDAGKDIVFVWDQETADVMNQMEEEGEYTGDSQNPIMNWTGPYEDENNSDLSMFIESGEEGNGDGIITITKVEGNKQTEWMMTGTYHEDTMTIDYTGCVKSEYNYENNEDTAEQNVIYEDGTGKLVITETDEESYISWVDDKENAGEGAKFIFSFEAYSDEGTGEAVVDEEGPEEDDVEEVTVPGDIEVDAEEEE